MEYEKKNYAYYYVILINYIFKITFLLPSLQNTELHRLSCYI